MTALPQSTRRKLSLLQLAEELQNVSKDLETLLAQNQVQHGKNLLASLGT
jgi:hypothetical protein